MPTLEEQVRGLSPAAMRIFKQQLPQRLKELSALERNTALSQLQRIPGLLEIEAPVTQPQQPQVEPEKKWWDYPLDWIRNVETGAGTLLAAPFTPSVPGTEQLPWWEKERAEYEAWDEPGFQTQPLFRLPWTPQEIRDKPWMIGAKGALEFTPWMATTLATAGLGGLVGLGARTGLTGLTRAAQLGQKVLKPVIAAERLPITLAEKAVKKVLPKIIERPTVVQKLTALIESAKPARIETEALKHEELVARVGKAAGILEKGEGREAFLKSKAALKGELPIAQFTPAEVGLQIDEVTSLFNIVRDTKLRYFEKLNTSEALQKLLLGQIPQDAELTLLERVFGSELVKAILKKRSLGTKVWERTMDIANAPRAVLASWDLSSVLRQGGILATRHPIQASKTIKPMLQAFASEEKAVMMDGIIKGRKYFNLSQDAGLYHAPIVGEAVKLAQREEMFMSRFARHIPLVRRSERALVTQLNDLRSRVFEQTAALWERTGQNATMKDYSELAKLINFATGRGSLGPLRGTGPLMNATLFSPRLVLSRLQLPSLLFSKSPLVRKEAFQTMAAFMGVGTSLLSLLKLGGAEIELDPRSADFAKAKIGETRLDFWTGYLQYARFITQLISAQRKTQAGNIQELNRREVVDRFMQSKFSPAFGLLNDMLRGESYMGEEMELDTKSIGRQTFNRLVPLFIQDMADAINQEGLVGGFVATPALFGVGAITYVNEVSKIRDKLAEPYGVLWEELSRETQLNLERSSLELQKALKEQEEKWQGETEVNYYSYGREIEKSYQGVILRAIQKYKATGDGTQFRQDVDLAAYGRRMGYSTRDSQEEFSKIVASLNEPISPEKLEKMHPHDVARRAYYDMIYSDDMIDEFGEYKYEEADKRKALFVKQFGQTNLDYVERMFGSKWEAGEPEELRILRQAREILKPYWEIESSMWARYPAQLKQVSDQILQIERTNPQQAKAMLFRYPQIVAIRTQIAKYKKLVKERNPQVAQALQMFYSY